MANLVDRVIIPAVVHGRQKKKPPHKEAATLQQPAMEAMPD
jgi:hypothetical protein